MYPKNRLLKSRKVKYRSQTYKHSQKGERTIFKFPFLLLLLFLNSYMIFFIQIQTQSNLTEIRSYLYLQGQSNIKLMKTLW